MKIYLKIFFHHYYYYHSIIMCRWKWLVKYCSFFSHLFNATMFLTKQKQTYLKFSDIFCTLFKTIVTSCPKFTLYLNFLQILRACPEIKCCGHFCNFQSYGTPIKSHYPFKPFLNTYKFSFYILLCLQVLLSLSLYFC